jgi:hypothetical protein
MKNTIDQFRFLKERLDNTNPPLSNIDFVQNLIENKNEEDLLQGLVIKDIGELLEAYLPIPGFPYPGLRVAQGGSFVSHGITAIVASDFDWILEFVKLVEDSFIEAFQELEVEFEIYRDFNRPGDKSSSELRWALQSKHPVIVRMYRPFTRYFRFEDDTISTIQSESGAYKITGYLDKAKDRQRTFYNDFKRSENYLRRNFSKYGRLELKKTIAYSLLDNPLDAKDQLNDEEFRKRFDFRAGGFVRRRRRR